MEYHDIIVCRKWNNYSESDILILQNFIKDFFMKLFNDIKEQFENIDLLSKRLKLLVKFIQTENIDTQEKQQCII